MHAPSEVERERAHRSLSVVVPVLDEAQSLPRLLERLGPLEGELDRPDELIVVDGGSSDGTPEMAQAGGARVLCCGRGRGLQLATGGRAASSELLLFLHADSLPSPGALVALRGAFDDPDLIAAGMHQRVELEGRFYRLVARAANHRVRRFGMVYGDSGLVVRAEDYRAVGGFREQPLFEDVDLSHRLRCRGWVGLVEEAELVVSARRWQREGRLRRTLTNWMLTVGYEAGLSAQFLARHYPAHAAGVELGSSPTPNPEEQTHVPSS